MQNWPRIYHSYIIWVDYMRKITLLLSSYMLVILPISSPISKNYDLGQWFGLCSMAYAGSNTLKVGDAFSQSGQQVTLHVDVKNDDEFYSYQLDIVLPSCLTLIGSTVQLTERAQGHTIAWESIGNNTYRFIAYYYGELKPFLDHSGAILRFSCSVNGSPGSYSITPQNIFLMDALYQNILTGSSSGVFTIFSQPARLRLRAWLEGWYNSGVMRTNLRSSNVLPWTSPYPQDARTASSLPSDIAEWALLELRYTASGDPIYYQSFLWKSNGFLCEMNGTTTDLTLNVPAGAYYILIHHRNHILVMSAAAITLYSHTTVYYDFTLAASQYYGQGGKSLGSGVYAIPCGDFNNDGNITSRDYVAWYKRMITSPAVGYHDEDVNGDGNVNNDDFLLWRNNARAGVRSTVP